MADPAKAPAQIETTRLVLLKPQASDAKDAWGQGYATEALGAMVDMARRIGVARLQAFCHPEHRASWRVLEKCGFVRDGSWTQQAEFPNLAPGVLQEVLCYRVALDVVR